MKNTDDELNEFQKKVFSEYEIAKSLKESSERVKKDLENEPKGCLAVPKLLFADWIIRKAHRSESRKRNYAENRREAAELLERKEISESLCEATAKISRREILTEEKFVNELTGALYRSDLAKQFLIPENPVLYALMAGKIFETGLENFCDDEKGD